MKTCVLIDGPAQQRFPGRAIGTRSGRTPAQAQSRPLRAVQEGCSTRLNRNNHLWHLTNAVPPGLLHRHREQDVGHVDTGVGESVIAPCGLCKASGSTSQAPSKKFTVPRTAIQHLSLNHKTHARRGSNILFTSCKGAKETLPRPASGM